MKAESAELRLRLTRVLDAPADAVFAACVDREQLARWWGPRDFTCPSSELDVRPGGRYRIAMQPPRASSSIFAASSETAAPRLHVRVGGRIRTTNLVTLTFHDVGGGTEVSLDQGPFATEAWRALHEAGRTDSFVRLAASV